jgi:hypothetical protein
MSLRWIPEAAKSFERSLLGSLYGWDIQPQVDPLKWVFHLRLKRHIHKDEVPFFRSLLKEWCEANDAVYKKSHWKKWDFKAVILIKGLGPVQDNSPFDPASQTL